MGILERLRPQPRWKHGDPAVRAAAVYDLGPEDIDALRALARGDAEPRVRRAAVARLGEPSVLSEVARTDPDETVRIEAIRGLAGIVAESEGGAIAVDGVQALLALGRVKEVALIAREASRLEVRAAAVDLLADAKSLGSICRHAIDSGTRLRALARLADQEEVLSVALRSEHTDAAVAALERIMDEGALGRIAQHARNKVAARRARAKLRLLEDSRSPAPVEAVVMSDDDRRRALDLLHRAEGLVALSDPDTARAALADVRFGWAEFQADVDIDPSLTAQFESASDAVREAIVEREGERAAEEARARAMAREQADRQAICVDIEGLSGAGALDRMAELKVRWDALPPMPSDYAASLNRRFVDACRAFEERERRRTLGAAAAERLESLATELEQLVQSSQPLEDIVVRWRAFRRDAEVLHEHAAANPSAGERLERVIAVLEEKEQHQQHAAAKLAQEHLKRLQQLCRQVETLGAASEITLKAGDRALRDIRTALAERVPLPSKGDRQEIQKRLEGARALLSPRVQELRDADEWQRWANLQVQEELCREMEQLTTESNLDLAHRRMRELQTRWKPVALAPRVQGEAMWRRFKTAQDKVFAGTAAYVAALHEERVGNLTRKVALCERAEGLSLSSDWVRTAAEIQRLQAEWKGIGPAPRGREKDTWERFRAACDRFFTRRQEDLRRRKDEWAGNLSRKEALCASAEALVESTDWDATAAQIKRLQAEWKTVGPVRKSKSDAVWERFHSACNRFFERYKNRDHVQLQSKVAPRDAVIRELEALVASSIHGSDGGAPDGLLTVVHEARARWQQAPELPRQIQQDMAARYHQALGRIVGTWPAAFAGTELDPESTRKRMEKLLARVEELVSEGPRVQARLSPAELLAQQWRERLAANTMSASTTSESVEAKWRATEQEIRTAQAQWMRLGPVPSEVAAPLNERFQRACRRFFDTRPRASSGHTHERSRTA